ncbi:hypothetical protein P8C59_001496 [Phyllachora maydis]|uniref:Uncharacterized protein n=1 Tax=Phyllachora maydis TaxID=1825666 RepID=A0AAD9MBG6_9PEZI|nr:hypothetical protein P8C59_001496 [Phyllachora maydis]
MAAIARGQGGVQHRALVEANNRMSQPTKTALASRRKADDTSSQLWRIRTTHSKQQASPADGSGHSLRASGGKHKGKNVTKPSSILFQRWESEHNETRLSVNEILVKRGMEQQGGKRDGG